MRQPFQRGKLPPFAAGLTSGFPDLESRSPGEAPLIASAPAIAPAIALTAVPAAVAA